MLSFEYFVTQSDDRMILSLEKNDYSEADLVQIKVPVNLPYFTDQKNMPVWMAQLNWMEFSTTM